ncbi:hypothetical protein [Streptomyces sp. NPDC002276]
MFDGVEAAREVGPEFSVLKCTSLYGLSFWVRDREWLFVTPRQSSGNATGLEAIEVPLSALMVSVLQSMYCF